MDSNIHDVIQHFNSDEDVGAGIILDTISLEQSQRKFINELIMKRGPHQYITRYQAQVEQLRRELDEEKMNNHNLKRSLDLATTTNADLENNLYLALKNARALTDKLEDRNDCFVKSRLQQDILISENQSLKELLQKAELEKSDQFQKIEELKSLHAIDKSHQKYLSEHQSKFRKTIAKFSETLKVLEADYGIITDFAKKLNLCDEYQKKLEAIQDKCNAIRKERDEIEEKYLIVNAKLEKLEYLTLSFPLPQQTECTVATHEYKKIIENLRADLTLENETVSNLMKNLNDEKEVTIKLCEREDTLERLNEELKQKLMRYEKTVVEVGTQTEEIEDVVKIKQEAEDDVILL